MLPTAACAFVLIRGAARSSEIMMISVCCDDSLALAAAAASAAERVTEAASFQRNARNLEATAAAAVADSEADIH